MNKNNDELLVVQFRFAIPREAFQVPLAQAELVDFAGLANTGLCVFFRGQNLKKLAQSFKKDQKNNYVASYWNRDFPLDVLNVFYYLHKPKDFSSIIFVESKNIPEALAIIEASLKKGASFLEIISQRSAKKNSLVIGTNLKNYKKIFELKKKFKNAKWKGASKPSSSLLRRFVVVKPN